MADPTWLRRGAHGVLRGGTTATWSVAEGTRGRRWREIRREAGSIVATLLEVDAAGRWTRLEMASGAGLLTLHPDATERSVDGNVVSPDGVRHHAVGWTPEHRLILPGSVVGQAALAAVLTDRVGVGEVLHVPGLAVDSRLHVDEVVIEVERPGVDRWHLSIAGEPPDHVVVDGDGWPIVADAMQWPLETELEMGTPVDAVWTRSARSAGSFETRG